MKKPQPRLLQLAFTLVELLVVILILGVLTAIALPSYLSSVQTSKLASGTSNARAIASAVNSEYVRRGGVTFNRYTADQLEAHRNIMADLSGEIPSNPCSELLGVEGYDISASPRTWTITPKVDGCPNAGDPTTIKLGK